MKIKDPSSISFSRKTNAQFRLRAYYQQYTRAACNGSETNWQEALSKLDPELHLRWNLIHKHYSIYYDHHGTLSVIRTFGPGQSFWRVFQAVKQNGATSIRQVKDMFSTQRLREQRDADTYIDDADREVQRVVRNAAVRKVTTDGVINTKY